MIELGKKSEAVVWEGEKAMERPTRVWIMMRKKGLCKVKFAYI